MRLTLRTNLAARVLMYCGVNQEQTVRSSEIAKACNASGNHLSQVIHKLQQYGYVQTRRGRGGGLSLARAPGAISIGALFRDFEADVPFAECFDAANNNCPLFDNCRLNSYMKKALDAFYTELDQVTLQDLVEGNCGLSELLSIAPVAAANCGQTARAS
ncbi:Rrf2 family transcriptional regulator [Maritimibacter sp. UBA3975]|uniref:RrF2 family transcriptional regulator n=1 Tax=Maritimibacter sp. UBA3975 TaxID=1946833 RepID=UPI000C0B1DB2|nr:Rrf2 family transcriptional regulator [Maritimibacter sp. UBA3975]MAM59906.1 Rrf2 family transcriptional regulator [Maritimibacter sp.]|tara:strand:- start:3467 stop:3943 length:477 start_codon:yes stop_codon:yes gene_type:complete